MCVYSSFGILIYQRELEYLAGVKTAFAGNDEAEHAYQREHVQIVAAEHFDAQYDGGEGGIGCAAEQADKTQSGSVTGGETENSAEEAAESCADGKGGNYLSAFKACSKGYGGENQLQRKCVPVCIAMQGVHGKVHACAVETLVTDDEGENENDNRADNYPQPRIRDSAVS